METLTIEASCREDMQVGALHRAITTVKNKASLLTSLGIGGFQIEIEPQGDSWRSIFGEIARDAIGKFQPISITWSPRVDLSNNEFLQYCRQETVLGWVMQF